MDAGMSYIKESLRRTTKPLKFLVELDDGNIVSFLVAGDNFMRLSKMITAEPL